MALFCSDLARGWYAGGSSALEDGFLGLLITEAGFATAFLAVGAGELASSASVIPNVESLPSLPSYQTQNKQTITRNELQEHQNTRSVEVRAACARTHMHDVYRPYHTVQHVSVDAANGCALAPEP